MKRWLAAVGVLVLGAQASATDPVTLRSLFSKEADVLTDGPGLVRLDLPPGVIADCLPSLADVRLFDPSGNEVPFLLDTPRIDSVFATERVETRPLEVRREEVPREGAPSLRRETFELDGPETAARGGTWRLVLDVARPEFVVRARASWHGRASGASGESTGSIFRILSPRPVEKLGLSLDAGPIARVIVTLEHEQPSWLSPSFRFESSQTIDRKNSSSIPLSLVTTRSRGGTTVVELARPRGVVPAVLRLSSSTAVFDRKVTVHDEGPNRDPAPLGGANLYRVFPATGVEDLDLSLRPARGDRLRIVIDDGDSPPLADLAFTAEFGQPSLVASLSGPGGEVPSAVLRFGGGRAKAPRYDLAGFVPDPGREVYGKRAEALIRLYDPAAIREARLGPTRPNLAFDSSPSLAFAMRPGASIDARQFQKRRPLQIRPSPEGLSRLTLNAEDLAALRADLADLRIVDIGSLQWPYLIERGEGTAEIPMSVATSSKNRATTYRLSNAVSPLSLDRLVIDADAPYFDREFTLSGVEDDDREVVLSRGRFARGAGDPMPVTIEFGPSRVTRLTLRIEDGDDAPLALSPIRARGPVPDIFVAAPAGSYMLLMGAAGAAAPSYELAHVRDVVLAVAAGAVETQPIEKNTAYKLSSRLTQGKGREQVLLWSVLIGAVIVLLVLTLRLARSAPGA
jgi:hypothetical protein